MTGTWSKFQEGSSHLHKLDGLIRLLLIRAAFPRVSLSCKVPVCLKPPQPQKSKSTSKVLPASCLLLTAHLLWPGPSELKLQITISTDKTVLELKQAIAAKSEVEAERQRLIYSGKSILKCSQFLAFPHAESLLFRQSAQGTFDSDSFLLAFNSDAHQDEDLLSVYKIQSSHTIHMVKGAPRAGGSSTSQQSTSQPLPTMQTGQNVHDPLTQLNSHLGFGALAGVNPFADMGLNPSDPNMVRCPLLQHLARNSSTEIFLG